MTEEEAQRILDSLHLPKDFTGSVGLNEDTLTHYVHVDGPGGWMCQLSDPDMAGWATRAISAAAKV